MGLSSVWIWLAEPLSGQEVRPTFTAEVAGARHATREEFEALYDAGQIRMDQTKLFCEDGLGEWARLRQKRFPPGDNLPHNGARANASAPPPSFC